MAGKRYSYGGIGRAGSRQWRRPREQPVLGDVSSPESGAGTIGGQTRAELRPLHGLCDEPVAVAGIQLELLDGSCNRLGRVGGLSEQPEPHEGEVPASRVSYSSSFTTTNEMFPHLQQGDGMGIGWSARVTSGQASHCQARRCMRVSFTSLGRSNQPSCGRYR